LYSDVTEVCYEGNHLTSIYFIVSPSLAIWSIGIPMIGLFLLWRNKDVINQIKNQKAHTREDLYLILETKKKYGFLFNGY